MASKLAMFDFSCGGLVRFITFQTIVVITSGCTKASSSVAELSHLSANSPKPRAVVLLDEQYQHLGSIPSGQPVETVFRFRNSQRRSIEVASIQKSCGCLEATVVPETIGPGEEARLTVKSAAPNDRATQGLSTTVLFLGDAADALRVVVEFDVLLPAVVKPSHLYIRGRPGQRVETSARVHKRSQGSSLKINDVQHRTFQDPFSLT